MQVTTLHGIRKVHRPTIGYAVQFNDAEGSQVHLEYSPTEEGLQAAIAAREAHADLVRLIEGRMCAECKKHLPDAAGPHPALCSNCSCDRLNAAEDAARPAERSWGDLRELTPPEHAHHHLVAEAERVFSVEQPQPGEIFVYAPGNVPGAPPPADGGAR